MSTFKSYPELVIDETILPEDGVVRVLTKSGKDFLITPDCSIENVERFVACWNACRKIAFPAAHIEASEEYVQRLELLRKEAWARAEVLQAEVDQLRASKAKEPV